jgi:hypothetical protein
VEHRAVLKIRGLWQMGMSTLMVSVARSQPFCLSLCGLGGLGEFVLGSTDVAIMREPRTEEERAEAMPTLRTPMNRTVFPIELGNIFTRVFPALVYSVRAFFQTTHPYQHSAPNEIDVVRLL